MYDSVSLDDLPAGGDAYAAYVRTWTSSPAAVARRFPGKPVLAIATSASLDGDCLDIEAGDATPNQAPGWVLRQLLHGAARPCVYSSLSTMPAILREFSAAGILRAQVRVWAAHWTGKEHICAPGTCGSSVAADGTQWADPKRSGGHWDTSSLADDFFAIVPAADVPPPGAAPNFTKLPTLHQGVRGQAVRNWQGLLCAAGIPVQIDGDFGPQTLIETRAWQAARGLQSDGIVGPSSWGAALLV